MKPDAPVTSTCWLAKTSWSLPVCISTSAAFPVLDLGKHFVSRTGDVFWEIDLRPGHSRHILATEAISQDHRPQDIIVGITHLRPRAACAGFVDQHREIARSDFEKTNRLAHEIRRAGPFLPKLEWPTIFDRHENGIVIP